MKQVFVHTDGSSKGNGDPSSKAGWAFVAHLPTSEKTVIRSGSLRLGTTNNQAELTAILKALSFVKTQCELHIVSDSLYAIQMVAKLSELYDSCWMKEGRKVANFDILEQILIQQERLEKEGFIVAYEYIRGHDGNKFNELADKTARAAADGKQLG